MHLRTSFCWHVRANKVLGEVDGGNQSLHGKKISGLGLRGSEIWFANTSQPRPALILGTSKFMSRSWLNLCLLHEINNPILLTALFRCIYAAPHVFCPDSWKRNFQSLENESSCLALPVLCWYSCTQHPKCHTHFSNWMAPLSEENPYSLLNNVDQKSNKQ